MFSFDSIVRSLSSAAYREVALGNGHLQAVAASEMGYAAVFARLAATPWSERWALTRTVTAP